MRFLSRRSLVALAVAAVAVTANLGPATTGVTNVVHSYKINKSDYKAANGHWDMLDIPGKFKVNAIHAAVLRTGKVLIVAGSGNDQANFDAGTFKTLLWNPKDNTFKQISTPVDLFCSGHVELPNGDLMIAGGTKRYEVLKGEVKNAGGAMTIKNESPNGGPRLFKKGTRFVSPGGIVFQTDDDVLVPPASKADGRNGTPVITASTTLAFVQAVKPGPGSVITKPTQFEINGLTGRDAHNLYGLAPKLDLDKQDYQGIKKTYVFNVTTERYERVGDMNYARWYPTLVTLRNGSVLASSGLDNTGTVLDGQTEIFDPATRKWTYRRDLTQYFPTYPSLFVIPGEVNQLFYSGSNAGYGPADKGRAPGIWDLETNTFTKVSGLKDANLLETSMSLLLPPAQDRKVMVFGGGGVGESSLSTARTAIIDLSKPHPHFTAGPDLPQGTRYLNGSILPDDTVFTTGGSTGYRGKHQSDILKAQIYTPRSNTLQAVADPTVGRDYHSESILLPDGRVVTLGSNPLFADKADKLPGTFEKRIEIFTPPYLYHGTRPSLPCVPKQLSRGTDVMVMSPQADDIKSANLLRPSAVTHVTDPDQRSIALPLNRMDGGFTMHVPRDSSLVIPGWYMLFFVNKAGTPSVAQWVQIGMSASADNLSVAGKGACCC